MVFDAETLAQVLEVVRATVAAAIAAHKESGGSRHDSSGRRGTRYSSEKGFKRVNDFGGQNWMEWNFHAMVEIATLEATSLNDGDLEQMVTELFDALAMSVKGDALTIIQRIRGMEARCAPTDPATAFVAGCASQEPAKAEGAGWGAPLRRGSFS